MSWDRQPSRVVPAPAPLVMAHWLWAAALAMFAGVLLFFLHAWARIPSLNVLDVRALSGSPLLVWVLAFGARAHLYGRALNNHQFLQERAQDAQQSWQSWAQRYLAVCASCVLLPDQVSASVLAQGPSGLPPRTGQARRIAVLSVGAERAREGLQMLIQSVGPALEALPADQELRLTLLSDVEAEAHPTLREALQHVWSTTLSRTPPASITLTGELPYSWVDETLKAPDPVVELVLILQVHGEQRYSDGLAVLLLCPDHLANALALPITAGVARPMPLDVGAIDSELPMFVQTQISANEATGLLADDAGWQPVIGKICVAAGAQSASIKLEQQRVQEVFCGLPGPLGHWLATALGVELARHHRRPLLVLVREKSRHWISTVTTGALA
ncbi:hypothetical protein [Pseudomonas viridiflava]|uniref:hypothetical protein n=1 Tax=Pseudomonas viridiflava TaxID=33069 RepID=UPI002EBC930D|nr:hypothetical protein [Pseudomonas viridiflava]